MPVIATPVVVPGPPSTPTTSTDFSRFVISPVISKHYDNAIPSKRRGVHLAKGQCVNISMNMFDYQGNTVDLTPFSIALSVPSDQVRIRYAEAVYATQRVANSQAPVVAEETGEITDAEEGIVQFPFPLTLSDVPGVYLAEVGIFNTSGYLHFTNTLYVYVNQGLFDVEGSSLTISASVGPPTLDEVRISMRDNGPEDNLLLDDLEFDVAEIADAAKRVVMTWNEAQPPVDIFFNTQNFPFKENMLLGMTGLLFRSAGMRHFRNELQYQAGGLSIDDMNKWRHYLPIGNELWQSYTTWVRQKKVQYNAEAAMGDLGSSFGFFRQG